MQIRDGLGRLDLAERLTLFYSGAGLGEVDVDDVSELVLGVVGDTDSYPGVLGARPQVLAVVAQVARCCHWRSLVRR